MFEEFNHFFQEAVDANGIDASLLSSPTTINLFKKYRRHGLPFFYYNADTRKEFGEIPPNILDSYFALCKKLTQKADISFDEYSKYLNLFYTVTDIPKGATIKETHSMYKDIGPDKKRDSLVKFGVGTKKPYNKSVRLFHTSDNPNIKTLKPFFRSQGSDDRHVEALFPQPRVYFGYNVPVTRLGGSLNRRTTEEMKKKFFDTTVVYEYVGPAEYITAVYTDPELSGGEAVYVETTHELPVKRITYDEYVNGIKDKNISESFIDDDDTSGTSDFDTHIDNDPDDCYCESSVVFDKGRQIKVDVSELPFDTVYHGSIKNISMFDDKRTVFVTPSIAMASIFAGRPDIYKLREIRQRYRVKSPDINLQYLEWSDPKTLVMKQPLKTVHVIIQGAPEITDHYKYHQAGYIYAFNIKDPAIRDHVYKSTAMGPNEYVIKGISPVPIEKIPIEIDVDVTGAELPEKYRTRLKQEESIPTSGDFAQYAQYADLDSARGPIQSIHMRPATEADAENMYNWEIESIHPDLQNKPHVQELIRKDVQQSIKDTQMIMDGDKTIGMFTACMIDDGEWRYIGEIYLIPEYRGRGIGTSILKNEIDNFDKIRLQVATTNTQAIKLYESLGFKIVKEVDGQMYLMEYDTTKETVQEAKLPAKKRNKLDDSDFALVYTDEYGEKVRKYPVHDEAHVRAAARMFPRGVPLKYRKQTANKILRRAHEYNIDTSGWNSVNHAAGKD